MSLANRALWAIDRNLRSDLTLGGLAQSCGVSRYHLAHAFGETTGMSVMEYARARRLSEAASGLAAGAGNILDLALEFGYASHEAFSRAFRAQFGTTPEAVRREASTDGLALVKPITVVGASRPPVRVHRTERAGERAFIGMSEHVRYGAAYTIAAQWGRFMPRYGEIEDRLEPIPWGINTNVDEDGNLDYVCAVKVARHASVPKGLQKLVLPPSTYAVFQHDGHISAIPTTYAAIWNDWQPEPGQGIADGASLERHMPTFNTQTGFGGVEIWVPLA